MVTSHDWLFSHSALMYCSHSRLPGQNVAVSQAAHIRDRHLCNIHSICFITHRRQRSSATRCRAWRCVKSRQSGWRSRQASQRRRRADAPAAASHRSKLMRPRWCGAFSGYPALMSTPGKRCKSAMCSDAFVKILGRSNAMHARRIHQLQVVRTTLQAAGRLLPEVVAHDDFVGRTGTHGGWHPQVRRASCSGAVS